MKLRNGARYYLFRIENPEKLSYKKLIKKLIENGIIIAKSDLGYFVKINSSDDFDKITEITGYSIEFTNKCINILNCGGLKNENRF